MNLAFAIGFTIPILAFLVWKEFRRQSKFRDEWDKAELKEME